MKGFFKIVAAVAVTSVTACAYVSDPSDVKDTPNKGSAFHQGLQTNYTQLAKMEYDERDWTDTAFFRGRAEAAAAGQNFGPQNPSERKLPADMVGKANALHKDLTTALDAGGRTTAPAHAARAQAMFDCWVQELQENFQPADIAWCLSNFETAFAEVRKAMAPQPMAAAAAPATPSAAAPAARPAAMPGPFVIYFEWNKSNIDRAAMDAIQKAYTAFKDAGTATLVIEGHTDTSGPDGYNSSLSQQRARAVATQLRTLGVKETLLTETAFGETQPAVKTGDGVREVQNRRAVLKIER